MTPLEKIEFIESHAAPLAVSLYHSSDSRQVTFLHQQAKLNFPKRIYHMFFGRLVINDCDYVSCDFDMLRGYRYNQIFLDRQVDNPLVYTPLLKEGGFIYCFEREEYVWDSLALEA